MDEVQSESPGSVTLSSLQAEKLNDNASDKAISRLGFFILFSLLSFRDSEPKDYRFVGRVFLYDNRLSRNLRFIL